MVIPRKMLQLIGDVRIIHKPGVTGQSISKYLMLLFVGSGVTGGGGAGGHSAPPPPQRLLTGKFLLTYREKIGKEKREKG